MPDSKPRDEAAATTGADFHPATSFFDSLGEGFGAGSLVIATGGVRARVSGLSARQLSEMAARYGIFARGSRGGSDAAVDLDVEIRRSPRDGFLRVRHTVPAEMYRLLTREEDGRLVVWSYEWAALWDRTAGRALLAATTDDRVVFDRIVENFLRVAFAHLALEKGALLLHGAGVVRDETAYVFFGPSGSGKTTVTTLSKGARILSDDLVILVPTDGGYAASSVPFRGLMTPPATSDGAWPLAGLFRLVKADEDRVEPLDAPHAVGELIQSLPFVTDCAGAMPKVLKVATDVAGTTPVSRLHFRKDAGFWRAVENVGRSAA